MANSTISQLTQATGLTGAEYMEAVQAGVSVRVTVAQIASLGETIPAPTIVASLGLPTAGERNMVVDATVNTFGTIVVGGGGTVVPVYADGTNWRIG
jgi:hypothetical protein